MTNANETRHCHHCGSVYGLNRTPGRSETCDGCGWDLKVCFNCVFYAPAVAYQCRERRADPVAEKHLANYCEYFEFAKRVWVPKPGETTREEAARGALKKLFGD